MVNIDGFKFDIEGRHIESIETYDVFPDDVYLPQGFFLVLRELRRKIMCNIMEYSIFFGGLGGHRGLGA